jgi:undecaprenyl-diphosphatase
VVLFAWDVALFNAVHHGLHNAALDPVMKFLTEPGVWKFPILIAVAALFLTRGIRGAVALLVLIGTLAISDQLSAKVIKPIVHRPRPSVVLADSKPLFGVRHSYAFPSVHAVNFSAAVPIVATVFPAATIPAATVAFLVCVSRVYVGDHWPSDVIVGALLGLGLGLLGRKAFLRLEQNAKRWKRERDVSSLEAEAGAGPSGGP